MLNTGIFYEGSISKDRKLIMRSYFKKEFIIDFIATIVFIINFSAQDDSYILIGFLIRILQINGIIDFLDNTYQIVSKYNAQYQLIKLLYIITVAAHIFAVSFYKIAQIEIQKGEQNTWLQDQDLLDKQWNYIYTDALYFSIITMVTVGYGDISPTTYTEKIFGIIMSIVGCGVFAFFVNTIDSIIRTDSQKSEDLRIKKFEVKQFMNKRNISKESQMSVIKALEYFREQEIAANTKGLEIIQNISKSVQDNIFSEYYGTVYKSTQVQKSGKFSLDFQKQIQLYLKEITVGPGHILFNQGETSTRFYILMEGILEVYLQGQKNSQMGDQVICILKGRNEIGYRQFYVEEPFEYSIRSQNVSRLVYFEKKDFIQQIKKFPRDIEKFFNIKENLTYNTIWRQEKCYNCFSRVHQTNLCPLIFPIVKDQKVYGKRNKDYQIKQEKTRYKREFEEDFRIHTFKNIDTIREEVMRIRTDLIPFEIDYDLNDQDQDFYFNTPAIKFREDGTLYIEEYMNSEEDEFFQSSYLNIDKQSSIFEIQSGKLNIDRQKLKSKITSEEEEGYSEKINQAYQNCQKGLVFANNLNKLKKPDLMQDWKNKFDCINSPIQPITQPDPYLKFPILNKNQNQVENFTIQNLSKILKGQHHIIYRMDQYNSQLKNQLQELNQRLVSKGFQYNSFKKVHFTNQYNNNQNPNSSNNNNIHKINMGDSKNIGQMQSYQNLSQQNSNAYQKLQQFMLINDMQNLIDKEEIEKSEHQLNSQNDFFLVNLDRLKNYDIYQPANNFKHIVKKLQKIQKDLLKKIQYKNLGRSDYNNKKKQIKNKYNKLKSQSIFFQNLQVLNDLKKG
ncbi:Cyclic nucleotide-binding protein [Pseudocohnilembus persalinus]|uniref:Cyclic nucleotide-binding protein n=1 Tax=Pseudocohnilembus persalinus TaxID=266149 RepID=A0A0V0QVM6_PSEPJ|nr:Cyclic nucleotide-binding protein [Pseudocohnilembus persalinus]|eukprot:KRX05992.1 Cyclic nucleotide-binding protein [Pseudocohnilembus persalinus]